MTSEKTTKHPDYTIDQQQPNNQTPSAVEYAGQEIKLLMDLCDAGRLNEAEKEAKRLLESRVGLPKLYGIFGNILAAQGRFEEAVSSYRQMLSQEPNHAYIYSNLGNALTKLGRFEEALASLQKAVKIDPNNFLSQGNLGNLLVYQGKFQEALTAYEQAVKLDPNNARMRNNLGNALMGLGRIDEAQDAFRMSLRLQPEAEAFYNLHSLLVDTNNMLPSIQCLEAAINMQPRNVGFKFYLGMLLDYIGRAEDAAIYLKAAEQGSKLDRARLDAWNYIKTSGKKVPRMISSRNEAYRIGMEAARLSGLVLEFGVRHGVSIRQIAGMAGQQVYGFDSFEGLPEAWHTAPKASFTTNGVIPDVPDTVQLFDGWFEDTLPKFVATHKDPVRFMNIDCDIYSSTKTILDCLSSQIVPGTVIIFDEYIGNEQWREDEYKAFQEAVNVNGWTYEYLAFSMFTKQVIVRVL
jgi:tetratricopeptide (TPR) repeat protein